MTSLLLALLVAGSARAQDSDAPFGDPETTQEEAPPPKAPAPTPAADPTPATVEEAPSLMPQRELEVAPAQPWVIPKMVAEAVVKRGSIACVARSRVQEGTNALSTQVRRPSCAVLVSVQRAPQGRAIQYDVIASTTGPNAEVVSQPTLVGKPGQQVVFESKTDERNWVRVIIKPAG